MKRLDGGSRNLTKRIMAFLLAGAMILQQSYLVFADDTAGSVPGTEISQPAKDSDGSVLQAQSAADQNPGSENGAEAEAPKETALPTQEQAEPAPEAAESTPSAEETNAVAESMPESNNASDTNASSEQGSSSGDAAKQGTSDNKASVNQKDNGVATFTLKDGEKKTASRLPAGVGYSVNEEKTPGYTPDKAVRTGTINIGKSVEAYINTYDDIGDLSVKKTVVCKIEADKTKDFHFTVALQPAAEFSGTHTFGDMTFTDGIAKFTLKDGETKTASGIPAGTHYTVQEDDDAGFIKAPSGGVSGTILHGETAEAAFTNTRRNGSLSVSKRVVTLFPEKLNQSFTFTVTLDDKTIQGEHGDMTFKDGVATVTLKHNETKTASNLPVGTKYKIEEAAADLFEVRSDNAEGVIDQETKTAHFVNTDTEAQHNIVAKWTTTDQAYTVRGLKIGETYILRERSAPHGYAIAEDTTFTVDKYGKVSGTVTLDDSGAAVVEDPRTESGTGFITVTKYTLKHDNAFKVVNRTFYTALFSDSELKHRVSDVKALVLPNTYTAEVTFDELPYGTYYVGETTEAGDAASTNAVVTKIEVEHQRADLSRTSPSASAVIKNTMAEGVLGAYASVNLTVNKKVVDSKGRAKKVKDTFYFALFSDKNFKNRIRGTSIQAISLSNQSEGSTVFANLPYTEQIYVAEVTKSGKLVSKTRNFGYSVKYSGNGIAYSRAEGGTITVTNKGGSSVKGASRQGETENGEVNGAARSVRTGDTTPILPLVITLILAAAAALCLAFMRKRMKNRSS